MPSWPRWFERGCWWPRRRGRWTSIRKSRGAGRRQPGRSIDGIAQVRGQKVFVLKFIQSRDPKWTNEPFFAKFDPDATWLDDLRPAFGEREFFFDEALKEIQRSNRAQAWGQPPVHRDRKRITAFGHVEWE